jgi:GNAT superfamily N-acetyltransferase
MINFYKSDLQNSEQLKQIWLSCFEDKPEAVDLFFSENKGQLSAYAAKLDGKAVAAVYLLKCSLNDLKAHYLCGAATLAQHRGQGIMTGLIEYALEDAKKDGDVFSLLFPASNSLYGYYSRLGYKANCSAELKAFARNELEKLAVGKSEIAADYEQLQLRCFKNNFLLQNNNFIEFAKKYYKLYGIKVIESKSCLAFVEESSGKAEVFYAAYCDFSELAKSLVENTTADSFLIIDKAKENSNKEKYGMLLSLDENIKIPDDVFIGITLG